MRNKKTTYLLIGLVVIVWGAIVYQIFDHVKGVDPIDSGLLAFQNDSTFSLVDSSYTLKLNYKDPFLKGGYVASTTAGPKAVENNSRSGIRRRIRQATPPPTKPAIVWPEIVFSGIILNDKTNEELGLIQIGESSYLFREGETRKDLHLLNLYPDSVQVKFQEEIKTIKK